MKKRWTGIIAAAVIITLAGCSQGKQEEANGEKDKGSQGSGTVQVKIGHSGSESTSMHQAWAVVKEYLEENGDFDVEIYPNAQLGGDKELQEAVQNGDIQMTACTTSTLSTFEPRLDVFSLPFAFPDSETAFAVLDGEFGQKMLDLMEDQGFKALGYFESSSYRELSSNKPVRTPDDVKGMKIRLIQSPIHLAIWESLGATPTPLAFSELYTALQQKTVDAQDNPLELLVSQRFYEVQEYVTLTNHLFQVGMATCNLDWFNSLSLENQKLVQEAVQAGVEFQRELDKNSTDDYKNTLKEAGLEIIELSEEEIGAFKAMMEPANAVVAEKAGQDLVEDLQAAIEAVK